MSASSKPSLHIVTGASGVGKSSLFPYLRKALNSSYHIHDFDEKLTKEVVENNENLETWRKEATRSWIREAEEYAHEAQSTVLLGVIEPSEVMEASPQIPVLFYLLETAEGEIEDRLMGKRFATEEKREAFRKAVGKEPEGFVEENKNHMRHLREEVRAHDGIIFDTSGQTPEQTAQTIVEYLV